METPALHQVLHEGLFHIPGVSKAGAKRLAKQLGLSRNSLHELLVRLGPNANISHSVRNVLQNNVKDMNQATTWLTALCHEYAQREHQLQGTQIHITIETMGGKQYRQEHYSNTNIRAALQRLFVYTDIGCEGKYLMLWIRESGEGDVKDVDMNSPVNLDRSFSKVGIHNGAILVVMTTNDDPSAEFGGKQFVHTEQEPHQKVNRQRHEIHRLTPEELRKQQLDAFAKCYRPGKPDMLSLSYMYEREQDELEYSRAKLNYERYHKPGMRNMNKKHTSTPPPKRPEYPY